MGAQVGGGFVATAVKKEAGGDEEALPFLGTKAPHLVDALLLLYDPQHPKLIDRLNGRGLGDPQFIPQASSKSI